MSAVVDGTNRNLIKCFFNNYKIVPWRQNIVTINAL